MDSEKRKTDQTYYAGHLMDRKEYNREYHLIHKKEHNIRSKAWYQDHKDIISIDGKAWRDSNPEVVSKKNKLYVLNNKEKHKKRCRDYQRDRRSVDPCFKLLSNLRRRVCHAITDGHRSFHTKELVGCDIKELMRHLESKFQSGMTWENYGEWHVDHIKPCSSFDLTDINQQKMCFNWMNLQPLWALENIRKSNKI